MSVDAPPPVLPIRDARIERATVPLCLEQPVLLGARHQVRRGATVVADGTTVDGWMKAERSVLPRLFAGYAPLVSKVGLGKAPGHDAGVFRPPRAA